jgi:hypothetical protein
MATSALIPVNNGKPQQRSPQVITSSAGDVQSSVLQTLNIRQRVNLLQYAKRFAENAQQAIGDFRSLLEYRDRAYQMQLDQTAQRYKELRKYLEGNAKRQIKDITVPIVMPQIESAVAYQAGVYLSSFPIFGVISSPQQQDLAIQFETVFAQHSVQYGWARELIKVFRDGFKYNVGAAFVHWKKTQIAQVTTSTSPSTAGSATLKNQTVGGNCIERLDLYNCFMDLSIDPAKHHEEGEAFGWNKIMNRMTFKRFCNSLDPSKTTNLKEAFESGWAGINGNGYSATDYYIPTINPYLNQGRVANFGMNWLQWAGISGGMDRPNGQQAIEYRNYYLVTPFVCRAMPSDFGKVGNTPTMYLAYIVNWQHVIYVEEIIGANDNLPVFLIQPNEDGLGYQTQSMLDAALPFQDMSSALWNISLESKKRLVFDRLIYNERFINKADIDPATAVARIPLRNASQFKGEDIGKAIYQIPYREDNSASGLQMSEMISQMADVASGQNKVDRGQFQKGNKTKTEFDTTMQNSSARQQLTSITIEHQFMTPVKETLKSNMLYNQQPAKMLNRTTKSEVQIDPIKLRDSMLQFTVTDGMLPMDKILSPDLMTVFLQTAQALPVLMTEYDVIGMFIYWIKLKGGNWLNDFKRNPQQQQEFLNQFQATSMAQNATPPEQVPGGDAGPGVQ